MLPLAYPFRWRLAGIFLLIAVLGASLAPTFWLWDVRPAAGWHLSDKALHFGTFLILAIWYTGQYSRRRYMHVALTLFAFGALIEICQSLLPYRTAEWLDLWADAGGIAAGILTAMLLTGGWSLRAETYLMVRDG